jgi:UDP-N-acetylglucosamine 2-epimerase
MSPLPCLRHSKERREQLLFCYSNADARSRFLIGQTKAFFAKGAKGRIFVNLSPVVYWSLLANVDIMVGNSGSGIMETASLALPTVNVGARQYGRERAGNVLDAEAEKQSILDEIRKAVGIRFKSSLRDMSNPYGDGHAAERIVEILTSVPLGTKLLRKRASYLDPNGIAQFIFESRSKARRI